jgi:hypothetical protein
MWKGEYNLRVDWPFRGELTFTVIGKRAHGMSGRRK